jgi:hypothetical protein
VIRF